MIEVIGDGVIVDDIGANSILGKRNKRERERETTKYYSGPPSYCLLRLQSISRTFSTKFYDGPTSNLFVWWCIVDQVPVSFSMLLLLFSAYLYALSLISLIKD